MIIRIVKLTFHESNITKFLDLFDQTNHLIRNYQGCLSLELLQDVTNPQIFFTYSIWAAEKDLESYRNSMLFKDIWSKTKPLFSEKAQAWTTHKQN